MNICAGTRRRAGTTDTARVSAVVYGFRDMRVKPGQQLTPQPDKRVAAMGHNLQSGRNNDVDGDKQNHNHDSGDARRHCQDRLLSRWAHIQV